MPRPTMPASSIFARLFSNMFTPSSRRQSRDVRKTAAAPAAVLEQKVMLAAFQNFDGVAAPALPAGWTQTVYPGTTNAWATVAGDADSGANRAFVPGNIVDSDSRLTSPSVLIDASNSRLSFRHSFQIIDGSFDGAVLEISIAGGPFQDIIAAGGEFIENGYSGELVDSSISSNPLAGRAAWYGESGGYITTVVDLPAAALGQNVQFRWRYGSDEVLGDGGWSIDTIELNSQADLDDQIIEATDVPVLNTTVSGIIDKSRDVDMYKFTVTENGQRLQFDLDTDGLFNPLMDSYLRLFDAAGNQLRFSDNNVGKGPEGNNRESFIERTFTLAGTYYIGVSGSGNSTYNPTTGDGDTPATLPVGAYKLNIGTAPKATIAMSNTNIREHGSSVVTFTFDQAVTNFSNADLTVENGTLTNVTSSNGGITWKATFKPTANVYDTTNVITLNLATVTDLVGTPGVGTTASPNYVVDTIVDENDQISEAALLQMNTSTNAAIERALDVDMYAIDVLAGQTLQFDIDTQGFATPLADSYLRIFNSAGTVVKTNDDAAGRGTEGNAKESFIQWTFATAGRYYIGVSAFNNISYNPTTGDNDVNSVLTGSYTLHVGTAPTATITMSDYDLLPGDTALVTIAFSEAVLGFTNADLTVENGTLTNVASADGGKTWTATFTPTAGVYDTTNLITLNNTGVTDTVGTPGAGTTTSPNYQVGPAPNSAQLAPDPLNPGEMYLLVNGTSGNDVITVTRPTSTSYNVVINGVNKGTFTSPSGIVVYGQDGNDKITLASNVTLDSLLDGGSGADTINGGGSNSVMLGGTGNDTLTGFGALVGGADNDILKSSGGRSLLIGGAGADNLTSQFGNDILIGGTTDHDTNPWALASIREEWNQNTPVATRIAHLAGLAGGGLNGTYLLVSDAVRAGTVHNDFAVDKLSNNSSLDWILPFSGDLRSKIIGQVNHA